MVARSPDRDLQRAEERAEQVLDAARAALDLADDSLHEELRTLCAAAAELRSSLTTLRAKVRLDEEG